MKKALLLNLILVLCMLAPVVHAQIPNAGFEDWTDFDPVGWTTNNFPLMGWTPVTQTAISHTGSSALKGEVILAINEDMPPIASTPVFPISIRYAELTGWHRFSPISNEKIEVLVSIIGGGALGSGMLHITEPAAEFTAFSVPLIYAGPGNPTGATIQIMITNLDTSGHHTGSYFIMDDLAFEGVVSVPGEPANRELPTTFSLHPNYPNPFNPTTTFRYDVKQTGPVALTIFDLLGQEVATLVSGQHLAGTYSTTWNAVGLPSGIYLCRMSAPGFSQVQKVMLVK